MSAPHSVTLAEIADRAGVHVSTVSRSLREPPSRAGSATVARIRRIAEQMGYVPDPAATALRTRRSGLLGVLVPRVTDYVLARIYEGADEGAHEAGLHTVVQTSSDKPTSRHEQMEQLLARRVEGCIIGDARLDGDELVASLKRRNHPYVLVNRRLRGHPSVTTDDVRGGELAAEHLIELGHLEVAVIAGHEYASTCVERTHGFVACFQRAGVAVPGSHIALSGADAPGGYEAAGRLLTAHPQITALFAINDFAAIGAMGAASELGRRVGQDIAVIGYNDIPLSRYLPVTLTSVASPMVEMGRRGALALAARLGGQAIESELLQPFLSARASTLGARHVTADGEAADV